MPLRLKYKGQTAIPVEVEGIIPSALARKTLAEIERIGIFHGKQRLALAEMFDVSGSAGDLRTEWEGDLAGVHWIGAKMDGGEMHVAGPAGRHLGSEMTAGRITADGDAGDWLGGQMRGGAIVVRGRAGHLVGAAYRGSPRGMTGGEIFVHGPAGNEIGLSMRRGLIAVGGAGDAAGASMIAGTILVFGPCGIRPGAGMRRGTIGLFGPKPPALLPTFRHGCRFRPVVVTMLLAHLAQAGFPVPPDLPDAELDLYHGDLVALGRGEVLLRDVG